MLWVKAHQGKQIKTSYGAPQALTTWLFTHSDMSLCCKRRGISSHQVDRLKLELFKEVEIEYQVERKDSLVAILDQLTHVYAQSVKTGQLSNALGAINTKVRLLRLDPASCR